MTNTPTLTDLQLALLYSTADDQAVLDALIARAPPSPTDVLTAMEGLSSLGFITAGNPNIASGYTATDAGKAYLVARKASHAA